MIPKDINKPAILREKKPAASLSRTKTTKLLPCPVGITSYKEVSSECYYVDKTMLIKDIIDEHSKVYLFTRPRRFGKTLFTDMLMSYYDRSLAGSFDSTFKGTWIHEHKTSLAGSYCP